MRPRKCVTIDLEAFIHDHDGLTGESITPERVEGNGGDLWSAVGHLVFFNYVFFLFQFFDPLAVIKARTLQNESTWVTCIILYFIL